VKQYFLIVVALLLTSATLAQSGRQFTPLYDLSNTRYLNTGWYLSPGLTYMAPSTDKPQDIRLTGADLSIDTLYAGKFNQNGRIGFALEGGRHKLVDYMWLLDHIDYGLGFKMFRGRETFDGFVKTDSLRYDVANESTFSESFVSAHFNLGNIYQLSDRTFLHNSLGLNADYRILSNRDPQGNFSGMIHEFPPDFLFQAHYRLGFGYRAQGRLYIIPSIETPVLTILKFDDGKSTLQYFSSRYRPLIFTLRFVWMDKRPTQACVGKSAGDEKKPLWDKDMSRKKKKRRRK
jgi:hypothetical protein